MSTGDSAAELARRTNLHADHEQFLREMRTSSNPFRVRSTIAGAGSHTEVERMRIRAAEDARQRELLAERRAQDASSGNAAALAQANAKLEAERAKKAAKRKKKAKKAPADHAGKIVDGAAAVVDSGSDSDES